MQSVNRLSSQAKPAYNFVLRVLPSIHGGFGVYADSLLIAIHKEEAAAIAHCLRLRNQQAQE
jgi:hypothetical protein